jgi:hypothetical protein
VIGLKPLIFSLSRIENLMHKVSFDPQKMRGETITTTSMVDLDMLGPTLRIFRDVIESGLAVSPYLKVETLGSLARIMSACSITVSGVLLKAGIPLDLKFGGLLQFRSRNPLRFIELIEFSGCSMSPAEIFVAGRMTGVSEVLNTGEGRILAHFCELPSACKSVAEIILRKLNNAGIGGVIVMGKPNETVCEMPVGLNKTGIILQSGLNPVAAAVEAGIEVVNFAMSGLIDYNRLRHFETYV